MGGGLFCQGAQICIEYYNLFLLGGGVLDSVLAEGSILDPCYVMWDVTLLIIVGRALADYLCCWHSVYKIYSKILKIV